LSVLSELVLDAFGVGLRRLGRYAERSQHVDDQPWRTRTRSASSWLFGEEHPG